MQHSEAKQIVDELVGKAAGPEASLFVRAVAFHETAYGEGWRDQDIAEKPDAPPRRLSGKGSFNMGAITAPGGTDENSFFYRDRRFDEGKGKIVTYETRFRKYESAEAGFADCARVVLKPNVMQAVQRGDLPRAVAGMYANRYFLGVLKTEQANVAAYVRKVVAAVEAIVAATGEGMPFAAAQPRASSSGAPAHLPRLKRGSKGPAVQLWRALLRESGYQLPEVLEADSVLFDEALHTATKEYQSDRGLAVDGVVGQRETWPKMVGELERRDAAELGALKA